MNNSILMTIIVFFSFGEILAQESVSSEIDLVKFDSSFGKSVSIKNTKDAISKKISMLILVSHQALVCSREKVFQVDYRLEQLWF